MRPWRFTVSVEFGVKSHERIRHPRGCFLTCNTPQKTDQEDVVSLYLFGAALCPLTNSHQTFPLGPNNAPLNKQTPNKLEGRMNCAGCEKPHPHQKYWHYTLLQLSLCPLTTKILHLFVGSIQEALKATSVSLQVSL